MKESIVNLHMCRKRTLFLIASFSLASFLICLFVVLSTNDNLMQLNSLLKSDYLYSATMSDMKETDAYLQYNAGISFAVSADSKTGVNADVVMQTEEANYTDSVYWNADKMKADEVAISKGIAKMHALKTGDTIYSKNVIDGTVHEYTISQVLPEVKCVRVQAGPCFTDGIIILGYDANYYDNVSHSTIVFTNADIDTMSEKSGGTLSNIIYREDEVSNVIREIAPYYLLLIALTMTMMVGMVMILKRAISHNFKRLITLGFDHNEMNRALTSLVLGTGIVSAVISLLISLAVFGIIGLSGVLGMLLLSVVFVECITLLIAEAIIKKQLWRQ